jgi:hypothetical protein
MRKVGSGSSVFGSSPAVLSNAAGNVTPETRIVSSFGIAGGTEAPDFRSFVITLIAYENLIH